MRILCLIPARKNSKGLPGKNRRMLAGKPLLAHTIEAALGARSLAPEDVVFDTDCPEMAAVAREYGARAPYLRPAELSTDEAGSLGVARHALAWMAANEGKRYDYLLLLQVTSPLRTARHVDEAVALAARTGADAVVSVTEPAQMPWNMKRIDADGRLRDLMPEKFARRQDMPPTVALNGAIYLTRTRVIEETDGFFGDLCYAYPMARRESVDIDDAFDFALAELLITEAAGR